MIVGPRQVGKTTTILSVLDEIKIPYHYISADTPAPQETVWLEGQWEVARLKIGKGNGILVIDEVQKIQRWSDIVKKLWDEDTRKGLNLHVVLLGSSQLLIQKGLSESLAGRFEIIHATHWSYKECRDAFGWDIDTFLYYGGYPGAAGLISDRERWRRYILDSLIETTISRDILLLTRVDKPALLRRLFNLACQYSGEILSYNKMLGQLQDAGNTTTLAHYLYLLSGAGMVTGIEKYSLSAMRQRASSPKFIALNNALITAQVELAYDEAKANRKFWGRLVESAVGAHLINMGYYTPLNVFYWREKNREVDFVIVKGKKVIAIEVKSGREKNSFSGLEAFSKISKNCSKLLIGDNGLPLCEFFLLKPEELFGK